MRKLFLAFALCLLPSLAGAQTCPTRPAGDASNACASTQFVGTAITNIPAGQLALPNGDIFVGNGSNVAAARVPSGDCTFSNTGVITCTKTNGVNFGAFATQPIAGRPWCNVRDQGAVGDGSTDDTAAFQACVTLLKADYGEGYVVVPASAAAYCIKSSGDGVHQGIGIVAPNSNAMAIRFVGLGLPVLSACGVNQSLVYLSAGFSTFEGFEFLGYGFGTDTFGGATVPVINIPTNCNSCRIDHSYIFGGSQGIQIGACAVYVEHTTFQYQYGGAMAYTYNCSAYFSHDIFDQVPARAVAYGTTISARANSHSYTAGDVATLSGIQAATIQAGGSGGSNGACLVTASGGTGRAATVNVTISGGAITAVNSIATAGAYTSVPSNPVTVTGCSLSSATLNFTSSAWYIQYQTSGLSAGTPPLMANYGATAVTDGAATFTLLAPVTYYGLQVDTGSQEVQVDSSDFTCFCTAGVGITNSLAGTVPTLTHLTNITPGGNTSAGIDAKAGSYLLIQGVEVNGCILTGCAGVFLEATWTGNALISNVMTLGSSGTNLTYGVYLAGGANTTISNGLLLTNATAAVQVSANVSNFAITGNFGGSIIVAAGTSTHYAITGNVCAGGSISDGGSGTKLVQASCP